MSNKVRGAPGSRRHRRLPANGLLSKNTTPSVRYWGYILLALPVSLFDRVEGRKLFNALFLGSEMELAHCDSWMPFLRRPAWLVYVVF